MTQVPNAVPGVVLMTSAGEEIPFVPGDVSQIGGIATADCPDYSEGILEPISQDLKGRARVLVTLQTNVLVAGTDELTPKFAPITASAAGATTVVAAVEGKKIRVLAYLLTGAAAVTAKFQSHTTPTNLTGLLYLAANGGYSAPFNPVGWFETVAGETLDIYLGGAQAVGGHLVYVEV